jgi:hypothetical protein
MEGSFAQAANLHHFKRARWRRLWRQQIQDCLIAACQNVRILVRALGRGPPAIESPVRVQSARALGAVSDPRRRFVAKLGRIITLTVQVSISQC